jgi:hypothetical protein
VKGSKRYREQRMIEELEMLNDLIRSIVSAVLMNSPHDSFHCGSHHSSRDCGIIASHNDTSVDPDLKPPTSQRSVRNEIVAKPLSLRFRKYLV